MSYNKKNMKAAVFIDHSNIASPILEPSCNRSVRINWKKLIDLLLNDYKVDEFDVPATIRGSRKRKCILY